MASISLEGIDQAISNLNYRDNSIKQKILTAIRSYYSHEKSISDLESINTDTIIKSVWNTGDDTIKIRAKRRNFSSIKSSINADLKKLSKQNLNRENITITSANIFDMSEDAKNDLLKSFSNAVKTGKADINQISELLKVVTDFLKDSHDASENSTFQDIVSQVKEIINKISTDMVPGSDEEDKETGNSKTAGFTGDEDFDDVEIEKGEGFDDYELDEDESIETIELDEDEELEEIDIDEDESPEDIEIEGDEDFDDVEIDEAEEPGEAEALEDVELEEDENLEEIEIDDDNIESIELDDEELEDLEEVEIDEDQSAEETEQDQDEDIETIELDEDEELEEVDIDEDESPEDIEIEGDEDFDDVEIDETEEPGEAEALEDVELEEDENLEEIEIDDDDIENIELDDEDLEEVEIDEDQSIEETEQEQDEDIETIELDEDELNAIEDYRKEKELAEHFDKFLGEKDKKYNNYVMVPPGTYTVGTKQNFKNTLKLQQIDMPEIYIAQYPVTNSLFEIFVENTGYITLAEKKGFGTVFHSRFKKTKKRSIWRSTSGSTIVAGACWYQPQGPGSTIHGKKYHPVVQISINDAWAFASWIGRRLPTETEWEACARTDMGLKYPWGNDWRDGCCNIEKSSFGGTTPVDKYDDCANEFNIVDLLGNVLEWTSDTEQDPFNSVNKITFSIAKGGGWTVKDNITIGSRSLLKQDFTSNLTGFRCVSEKNL